MFKFLREEFLKNINWEIMVTLNKAADDKSGYKKIKF